MRKKSVGAGALVGATPEPTASFPPSRSKAGTCVWCHDASSVACASVEATHFPSSPSPRSILMLPAFFLLARC